MVTLTELKISPKNTYRPLSDENPMVATVKINTDHSVVETVLPPRVSLEILSLCRQVIADAARENVNSFCDAMIAVDGKAEQIELKE